MTSDPPAEAIERLPTLGRATVSSDGQRVAFYYTGTGANEIHVRDLARDTTEQWTDGDAGTTNIWPLAWTSDGEQVLFHRDDADGAEQYDVLAVDASGETERLTDTDGSTQLRGVGPTGRLLLRSNHEGSMEAYLRGRDGGLRRLTDRDRPVYYPVLSTAGDRVTCSVDESIRIYGVDGETECDIELDDGDTVSPTDWGAEDGRLLIGGDAAGVERPGILDLDSNEVTWFGDAEHVEEPRCFLPGGQRFLAIRKRDALTVPIVYDTETGESNEFDLPAGVSHLGRWPNRVVDKDSVLVSHAEPTRPVDLVVYDIAAERASTVFEHDPGPFDSADFVDPVFETVTSDGVPETSQAAVQHDLAETFDIGTLFWDSGVRPSPLVVFPHGGPNQSSRRTFRPRVQFLCRRGYSVLQVNYRGSSGRGRAFSHALYGDWGGAEQGDIATAVEHALDSYPFIDEGRVAVYGGSFGGYCAYWQMVQFPELYAAGVAVNGMTDLELLYEEVPPQFRAGFLGDHLGAPEANPDLYEERSPVTHAGNLDAPLLLLHGVNDPRVPVSQARRFRDALVDIGDEKRETAASADGGETAADADFEYHELDGSGHWEATEGVSKPLTLLDDFLDRRL